MIRIAFERLAAQLPPEVFVLPPRRLGESLREPHTLFVPRRLVVPQLGEGAIDIPWTLVEDQFPDLALALPRTEIRRRFPDWVLSLPLEDVIGQIPPDLFRVAGPAADLSDIGRFPAPFTPGPPAPVIDVEEPAPDVTAPPMSVATAAASSAPSLREPGPVQERPAAADPTPPRPTISTEIGVAPATSAPPPAGRPVEPRDDSLIALTRALAITLAPVGALESGSRRIGGRPLICFVAPVLRRETIDTLAARVFTLLERLAPSSVDQITVRTSRVACVVGMLAAGGTVATAVRRGGPVALVELLTARARGASRGAPGPGVPTAVPVSLADGSGRVGEAARALSIFGPLVPTVVTAGPDVPGVYVFAGRADARLAGAAREIHDALVRDHDESVLGRLESVALRRGRERVIVRPLGGVSGTPALLAAAGEISLPGRAQRATARAATLLEAR